MLKDLIKFDSSKFKYRGTEIKTYYQKYTFVPIIEIYFASHVSIIEIYDNYNYKEQIDEEINRWKPYQILYKIKRIKEKIKNEYMNT